MIYYTISPNCTDGNNQLYLTGNGDNSVTVCTRFTENVNSQHWTPIHVGNGTDFRGDGFVLYNEAYNMVLLAPKDYERVQLASSNTTERATWCLTNGHAALQLQGETSMNLNVQGNEYPSGTPVIIYRWGGGTNNECWTMSKV